MCGELYVGETGRSLEDRVEKYGQSIERQDVDEECWLAAVDEEYWLASC